MVAIAELGRPCRRADCGPNGRVHGAGAVMLHMQTMECPQLLRKVVARAAAVHVPGHGGRGGSAPLKIKAAKCGATWV